MSAPSPPHSPDAFVGSDVGPYRVVGRVGAGGMGVVYRATDTRLGREVALKLLAPGLVADDSARARLLQEARAVAALDHVHLASIFDVGETHGQPYLAMAFYHGETLRQRLDAGPLAPAEAAALGAQLARGLAAAHRAGVIHRDLKPANVMLLPSGGPGGGPCVKVLDFGIAHLDGGELTQDGESLGTALYMSPEQLRGERADAQSDVWALGVVLFEMVTGRRPFDGAYAAARAYAVLHEPAPPLPADLPPGLVALVAACLEKDPAARPSSMDAAAEALEAVRRGPATPAPTALPAAPDRATARLPARALSPAQRLRRGAALALAIGAVVAGAFAVWPGPAEAGPQRLAVLPFLELGTDAGPLSAGLVETVTAKLGQLAPVRARVQVVPASEVERGLTPTEARERFGATLVVEGTVQVEGGRVRVTLSLVDVGGGTPNTLDSREVDDTSGSAFALQDAAVLAVADLLRVEVGAETQAALAAGGTDDPEANEFYLRGIGELRNQQGPRDLERARALFAGALALDSTFALAHAGLAEAHWQTYVSTSTVAWADSAVAEGRRALAFGEEVAEVHLALGVIHEGRGEYGQALRAVDRALALDPRHAEATRRLARVYAGLGRTDDAEATFRRAIDLAPDYWLPYNTFGVYHLRAGRTETAAALFREGLDRSPSNRTLLTNLALAAFDAGDLAASEAAWERLVALDPDNADAHLSLLGVRFAVGDYAGAAEAGARAAEARPDDATARLALAEARRWAPGQRRRAEADYRLAIRLAHDHLAVARTEETLLLLGSAFAGLGEADSARAYLDEVTASLSADDASVQQAYDLGVAFEKIGDRDRALVWLRSALSRGFGTLKANRSPWLRDLRASPDYPSLTTPAP